MPNAHDLQQAGMQLASVADRLSATFARELARVLTLAERALLPVLQDAMAGNRTARVVASRALLLRREIQAVLVRAGYERLVTTASIEAVAQMADALKVSGALDVKQLGALTPKRLEALARLMKADLLGVGEAAAHRVWRAAAQAVYTDRPASVLVQELAKQLEKSLSETQTIFDTQVSITGRQMEEIATEDAEEQVYLYVGPVDARTRDWCLDLVGKVRSKADIARLSNGQLPNVFLTAGGYNCRHSWLAVSDPAVVGVAGGDTRADGYDGRVAVARALKTQRKRLREYRRAA
jgi:hypothetical protein